MSFAKLDEVGSVQWPCNDAAAEGTPIMHEGTFVRGLGQFSSTPFVPTDERSTRRFPLLLTTGRILSQYNVGAQTAAPTTCAGTARTCSRSTPPTPRSGASATATR